MKNIIENMNVLFVNMPLRESAVPNTPPEGPCILGAILKNEGAIVSLLDLNGKRIIDDIAKKRNLPRGRHMTYSESIDYFLAHIRINGTPDVIAFSGMITTLRWQEEFAKIVKSILPDCFLVTGGGLATEISKDLFNWIPELDGIARSEGDDIIKDIVKDAYLVKQMGILKYAKSTKTSRHFIGDLLGRPRFLYEGGRPKDLDSIPYPLLEMLETSAYGENLLEFYINNDVWGLAANNSSAAPFTMKRSLTTVSSRGCPYSCAFCYRGAQGERNYGMRSAEHIAKQIKEYVDKYNLDFIGFPDDNFAVQKKRIAKMVPVFKEYGLDHVRWGTHTRMDEADARVFKMAESGCVYIGFGAESAHEKTLKRMQKGGFILSNGLEPTNVRGKIYHFPKTMKDAIMNCHEAGIHANCTWIMGYPGETLQELQTSVAFIAWQQDIITNNLIKNNNGYTDPKVAINRNMFTATAYPGTAMFKDESVKKELSKNFKISFNFLGAPKCDENFHKYVLELDDATKVLKNSKGDFLNYSNMSNNEYMISRKYIDSDNIEKILEMKKGNKA